MQKTIIKYKNTHITIIDWLYKPVKYITSGQNNTITTAHFCFYRGHTTDCHVDVLEWSVNCSSLVEK
jgi:hypothetical protein